jgi:hypothetical protein
MEHSLHLVAKHFVQAIALHSSKSTATGSDSEDGPASDGSEDNNDHDEAIIMGDLLGKAITLVKQVSVNTIVLIHCAY